MRHSLALALFTLGVAAIVEPTLACEHAAGAKTTSAEATSQGTDAGVRPADQLAWNDYETSLAAAMRGSERPRESALAAIGFAPEHADGSRTDPGPELARAAQSAPNDALVQWLAANNHDSSNADDARIAAAIARLTQLESDNGAVWMLALSHAARNDDAQGVADALARMAASRRFDDHYLDTAHAWFEAYDRHPPATPLPDVADGRSQRSAGFVGAIAKAAAVAMPAYVPLTSSCKSAPAAGADADQPAHCLA